MPWFPSLSNLLDTHFPGVYTIVRPGDMPGRPYFTFTADSDHEACETARKVMKGNGSAELWKGRRLVEII